MAEKLDSTDAYLITARPSGAGWLFIGSRLVGAIAVLRARWMRARKGLFTRDLVAWFATRVVANVIDMVFAFI